MVYNVDSHILQGSIQTTTSVSLVAYFTCIKQYSITIMLLNISLSCLCAVFLLFCIIVYYLYTVLSLLGLDDPWATSGGGGELPPSYDLVTKTTSPSKQPAAASDPFGSSDPFAPPLGASSDPWTSTATGFSVSVAAPPPSTR